MPATDKTGLLKTFLGSLPGHVAARLALAVEVDRLLEGRGLPHDDILSGLRPVLRRDHHDRTLTPLRLFCRPFQDLLSCAPRRAKQKGCIARGSLVPVWFFPESVQRICNLLPFVYIYQGPLGIYIGKTTGRAVAHTLALQAVWAVLLFALLSLVWRRVQSRVMIQGG